MKRVSQAGKELVQRSEEPSAGVRIDSDEGVELDSLFPEDVRLLTEAFDADV
jgi:hypothetical protein